MIEPNIQSQQSNPFSRIDIPIHRIGTDGAFLKPLNGNFPNPLSTSREYDSESQNYYYRARQYNPYSGRFNRRDPIGYSGGLNIYTYVSSNPVNRTDPNGLKFAEKCPSKKHQFPFSPEEGKGFYPRHTAFPAFSYCFPTKLSIRDTKHTIGDDPLGFNASPNGIDYGFQVEIEVTGNIKTCKVTQYIYILYKLVEKDNTLILKAKHGQHAKDEDSAASDVNQNQYDTALKTWEQNKGKMSQDDCATDMTNKYFYDEDSLGRRFSNYTTNSVTWVDHPGWGANNPANYSEAEVHASIIIEIIGSLGESLSASFWFHLRATSDGKQWTTQEKENNPTMPIEVAPK